MLSQVYIDADVSQRTSCSREIFLKRKNFENFKGAHDYVPFPQPGTLLVVTYRSDFESLILNSKNCLNLSRNYEASTSVA